MSSPANDTTASDDHGIAGAYYGGGGFPNWPTLECSCGVRCKASTWEEAGAMLDAHLSEEGSAST